jgi:hypothetical protein
VELPLAAAIAQQAVELNAWLDGGLDDAAVALSEDERLRNAPLNRDEAADDVVVEVLDRKTGLIRRLGNDTAGGDPTTGRGLTRVRVAEGDRDFVVPSMAAKGRTLAFFESEFGEGLAGVESTQAELLAADLNNNSRLDQNLRVFAIDVDNPLEEEAQSLLPESTAIGVLPDLRFRGRKNLVLSEDPDDERLSLFFAYSPLRHDYQLLNQSSDGVAGNSSAGEAVVSSDGTWVAFVSDGNNLYVPAPPGPLSNLTSGGTAIEAVTGPGGEFPVVNEDGKTVFEYTAIDNGQGPAPSRMYVELKLCDSPPEPDLVALLNPDLTGPNGSVQTEATSCSGCNFEGSWLVQFDQGLGKGGTKSYSLVFDEPVPPGEVGVTFKAGGKVERTSMRGPACIDPTILAGIDRVYLRNTVTGSTELVSAPDRSSCEDQVRVRPRYVRGRQPDGGSRSRRSLGEPHQLRRRQRGGLPVGRRLAGDLPSRPRPRPGRAREPRFRRRAGALRGRHQAGLQRRRGRCPPGVPGGLRRVGQPRSRRGERPRRARRGPVPGRGQPGLCGELQRRGLREPAPRSRDRERRERRDLRARRRQRRHQRREPAADLRAPVQRVALRSLLAVHLR